MADDAAADRGLRRRGVWLRIAPARQRGDRQRDRDRARRLGRDGRFRAGLPRGLLAGAPGLPAERAGWRPAVLADQRRRLVRIGQRPVAGRRPGRSREDPRSSDRVRIVADDPRGDVGRRAADPGRPSPRGRPAPRHRHQRVGPATRTTGRGPRPDRGAPERPRAGRRRHRRHGRRVQSLRPVAVRPGRRPAVLLRRERDAGDRPVGRSAEHDRPADVRPDDGLDQHPVGRRPGRAGLGLGRPGPGRGRRPDAASDRQRPVLRAGRTGDQGRHDVPRGPAALDGRRVRRADVHEGSDDHELRPGQRHRRLPADRVRRSDDSRPS